ncbi:MAG: Dabb family protein [Verrucomicrobiota bacterium]
MKHVKHIAFFKFKPTCTPEDLADVWRIVEDLPRRIPGIVGLTWGPNISTEGLDQGFTHSFVMEFENVAARDAYLPHPIHQEAVRQVLPRLESVIVCDHEFEV